MTKKQKRGEKKLIRRKGAKFQVKTGANKKSTFNMLKTFVIALSSFFFVGLVCLMLWFLLTKYLFIQSNENSNNSNIDVESVVDDSQYKIPLNTYFYTTVVKNYDDMEETNVSSVDLNGNVRNYPYRATKVTPSFGQRWVILQKENVANKVSPVYSLDKKDGSLKRIQFGLKANEGVRVDLGKYTISSNGNSAIFIAAFFDLPRNLDVELLPAEKYNYVLYKYDFETSKLRKISETGFIDDPSCSLFKVLWDEKNLYAYLSFSNGMCSKFRGVYMYDVTSNKLTKKMDKPNLFDTAIYLPITKIYLFESYAREKDDQTEVSLTIKNGDKEVVVDQGEFASFQPISDVSLDNRKFAYFSNTGRYSGESMKVFDIEGNFLTSVPVFNNGSTQSVDWISDTKIIVENRSGEESDIRDLFLFDIVTKELKQLTTLGNTYIQEL